MDDTNRGIYNKYRVERMDGSTSPGGKHRDCEFFVLDLVHDEFAIPALQAYMIACGKKFPELAKDLQLKLFEISILKEEDERWEQTLRDLDLIEFKANGDKSLK